MKLSVENIVTFPLHSFLNSTLFKTTIRFNRLARYVVSNCFELQSHLHILFGFFSILCCENKRKTGTEQTRYLIKKHPIFQRPCCISTAANAKKLHMY